ncbi:MAG: DegT/DnrJ/EryC1/StrS family aminotransferase, partial [Alphaproteobacteria bacterium]|nr:DegT/DnrJ/EryC1/StrS family aminotransferase [Alphaproteobacteria bacterium]
VITTAMTAVATVSAIEMSGAKAVFADIRPEHGGLDPASVASVITPRTRAIIAVHLYGHPLDMNALLELAAKHKIAVIEDCAQAHGAALEQTAIPDHKTAKTVLKKVGSLGVMGCFSFYPTKNLGAIGDGGAVVTNDAKLAEKLRGLRQYGWVGRQISEFAGYNSRLDELQSAILRVKLRYLARDNAQRKRIAETYLHGLSAIPELRLPWPAEHTHPAWHLFVIQCANAPGGGESSLELRQKLKDHMAAQGINCGIHYPMPIYLQPAYRPRYANVTLTMTEEWSRRILTLPIYPELPMASVERVIQAVRAFFAAVGIG